MSASPSSTSRAASVNNELPVAQPLSVDRAGRPVMPTSPVTASGLATSRLPAQRPFTSVHATPASANARPIATAPISKADLSGYLPNGCRPTPMMAISGLVVMSFLRHGRAPASGLNAITIYLIRRISEAGSPSGQTKCERHHGPSIVELERCGGGDQWLSDAQVRGGR